MGSGSGMGMWLVVGVVGVGVVAVAGEIVAADDLDAGKAEYVAEACAIILSVAIARPAEIRVQIVDPGVDDGNCDPFAAQAGQR